MLDPAPAARALYAEAFERLQAARPSRGPARLPHRGRRLPGPAESPDLAAAAVWGLVRSAQSEHPGRFVLLDSDGSACLRGAARGAAGARSRSWRCAGSGPGAAAGRRRAASCAPRGTVAAAPRRWRGRSRASGRRPRGPRPLEPGEVRVAVRAAGLNFRDVLIALGMVLSRRASRSAARAPGSCSRSAPEVSDLAPGDRVMGLLRAPSGRWRCRPAAARADAARAGRSRRPRRCRSSS